ncbi:unnamed protein product [Urochloa decumbens]|uniref:Protein SNOWY COTYLEDON 3 n=1 Tax=Urochloa decumbens TaxID=240449 RepID=A0ABC9D9I1_9POAL
MPSTMVDATAATPPLDLTGRHRGRPATLSNTNGATCVTAALSDANANAGAAHPKSKSKTVASRYLTPSTAKSPPAASAERPRLAPPCVVAVASCGSASTTTRTLAVAFQSPTYSLETTRARSGSPAAAAPAATPAPEKKRFGSAPRTAARSKVSDATQNTYRWPPVSSATALTRGVHGGRSALDATKSPERSAPNKKQSAAASARRASVDGGANEYLLFNGFLSSPFGRSSLKQPSASKPLARSSFRRTASPSPGRRSTEVPGSAGNMQGKASSTGCGFDGGTKPKPCAAVKAEEEHQLRLLYTRELQWRFANAQAGAALSLQTMAAEKTLSGGWIAILRTRKSVAIRKMQLQLLRNNCKLMAVLRGQMKYLEEWSFLERDHAHSLSGTTQALNATVLRLPVSNGAIAQIQGIKYALRAAVDVMHPIGNSTSTQLPKLARTKVLVSQLSRVFIQEHILIAQCRDLLSTLASMHVKYSSLQAQRIQINKRRRQHFQ